MNRNRTVALAVGIVALGAVIGAWFWLSGEGAPPFPAIPGPPEAKAPVPAASPSGTAQAPLGRETPAPEERRVQIPDAASLAPTEMSPAPTSADPAAKARKPIDPEPLRHAALKEPKNPQRWVDLAIAYNDNKDYEKAVAALKRALHVGKSYPGRVGVERLLRDYERMQRKPEPASSNAIRLEP
jgi:hypothetical protein